MSSKIALNDYLKEQEDFYEKHVKFHAKDAFCGTTSLAEMKHINKLLSKLSDSQLQQLVTRGGIHFGGSSFDRDSYENVVDEISREKFYEIYNELTK